MPNSIVVIREDVKSKIWAFLEKQSLRTRASFRVVISALALSYNHIRGAINHALAIPHTNTHYATNGSLLICNLFLLKVATHYEIEICGLIYREETAREARDHMKMQAR